MEFKNPLLAVRNMAASIDFYKRVLGLEVIMDFGANVTLTGGVCLQTLDTWQEFIGEKPVSLGGNTGELYFEEDEFDAFVEKLKGLELAYVHPVKEHRWSQRVVRFYDPDRHIIEVGEKMEAVARRFLDSGMTGEQVAQRMDVPLDYVRDLGEGTEEYTPEELTEAKRQIASTLHKLEEVIKTLEGKENPLRYKSQITLAKRRVKALGIADDLIETALKNR